MAGLTIGKVSERTGCNIETIRYYEKEGLLPPPGRSAGGHRLFSTELVDRIVFIKRCRELGFPMVEIRQLLSLVDQEHASCEKVKQIAEHHLQEIEARIEDLVRMEKTLHGLVNRCSGKDVPDCPIIQALSA